MTKIHPKMSIRINNCIGDVCVLWLGASHLIKEIVNEKWEKVYKERPNKLVRKCEEQRCININHYRESKC